MAMSVNEQSNPDRLNLAHLELIRVLIFIAQAQLVY